MLRATASGATCRKGSQTRRLLIPARRLAEDGAPAPDAEPGRRRRLAPVLRTHLRKYAEAGPNGRVFVGARGGSLRRPRFQATWRKATTAVDLPALRFHDLRHAGATWAAQAGATVRELQERLGHASPAAAMIYQHSVDERAQQLAQKLSDQLGETLADGAREGHEDDSSEEEE